MPTRDEILAKLAEDKHAYCSANLSGADLSGGSLENVDFFDTDLTNANLEGV
ncbi:MAG: pentapeptide repeat-containing protein, partial [Candidatus Heimdallarchaeota archaeon]